MPPLWPGGWLSFSINVAFRRQHGAAFLSDHIEAAGAELFALACKRDLEGIVAKHKFGPYVEDSTQWFKIRSRKY